MIINYKFNLLKHMTSLVNYMSMDYYQSEALN